MGGKVKGIVMAACLFAGIIYTPHSYADPFKEIALGEDFEGKGPVDSTQRQAETYGNDTVLQLLEKVNREIQRAEKTRQEVLTMTVFGILQLAGGLAVLNFGLDKNTNSFTDKLQNLLLYFLGYGLTTGGAIFSTIGGVGYYAEGRRLKKLRARKLSMFPSLSLFRERYEISVKFTY